MNTIETIRQKCIEANPSILDLKFGCEILISSPNHDHTKVRVYGTESRMVFFTPTVNGLNTEFRELVIILGRPVTLADVLLAMNKKMINVELSLSQGSDGYTLAFMQGEFVGLWNLTASLEDQSPETLKFLANLLSNE